MIKLNDVTFAYKNGGTILKNLSLHVKAGERVRITGESGIGKTTVLRLIMGLEKPRRGTVTLADGARISAVFQEDRLIPNLSAIDNVALFSAREKAAEILTKLGLGDDMDLKTEELSGGMKRRVALARALARPSEILILDEAMTGLDEKNKERTAAVVNEYLEGRTLVCVTHDRTEADLLGAKDVSIVYNS